MPLTNQPYLPLYVKDWLTNNKLKMCSPGAHGLLINIMCLMHKEHEYGVILLKQKFKQSDKQISNFARMLARMLAFDLLEIEPALEELIEEGVLKMDGEKLFCNRMVEDAELSSKRAKAGKKGGEKTTEKISDYFAQANSQANSVNENEIIIEVIDVNDNNTRKAVVLRNDDFLEFWKIYDKQIDEDDCARIWRGLRPQDREMILQIVPLYVKSQPEQQFRKNPKGFLLGKCWKDRDIIKNFKNKNNDWITEKLRSIV